MWPGRWVMHSDGRASSITDWGVMPQAQKSGSSSARTSVGSPAHGWARFFIPINSGKPRWTGAPCTRGYREVISIARIASAGLNGRMETTSLPRKRPAGHGVDAGAVHRHVASLLDVAQPQPGLHQRLLEGERAAQDEGDQVVAPELEQVRDIPHLLSVREDPV